MNNITYSCKYVTLTETWLFTFVRHHIIKNNIELFKTYPEKGNIINLNLKKWKSYLNCYWSRSFFLWHFIHVSPLTKTGMEIRETEVGVTDITDISRNPEIMKTGIMNHITSRKHFEQAVSLMDERIPLSGDRII